MITYAAHVHRSKGYSGKTADYAKGYIAQIVGLDKQYGFAREFLDGEIIGSDYYRKSKCQWDVEYQLEPGLYEVSEGGGKCLWIISIKDEKALKLTIDFERARKIARLMDEGMEFNEARRATKPQAQPQVQA